MQSIGEAIKQQYPNVGLAARSEQGQVSLYPDDCPDCRGVGYLFDEAEWERKGFRGGLVPCPRCGAARQQARLERVSGLSPEMQRWTLDGFSKRFGRQEALKAAREAVAKPRGFVTFWGSWGTGKTYLLASIVNECRQAGMASVYTTVADLLDEFRTTFDPKAEDSYSALWHRVLNAHVLALDETEKFRATEWAEERFFALVDNRYRRMADCLTLFATNVPVRRGSTIIERTSYPGYLEDRLLDGRCRVVQVEGGSVRPHVGWSN